MNAMNYGNRPKLLNRVTKNVHFQNFSNREQTRFRFFNRSVFQITKSQITKLLEKAMPERNKNSATNNLPHSEI